VCGETITFFFWTSEVNKASLYLKHGSLSPILSYPNPDDQSIPDTDASNQSVDAEAAVAYYSQVLSHNEQQYTAPPERSWYQ